MLAFDVLLCGVMLATAVLALFWRDLLGAIAFFIIFGIFVAIAWLMLDAPDVALAEAAIGAGLTGLLLIGAWEMLSERDVAHVDAAPGLGARIVAGAGCAGLAGLLGTALVAMPDNGGLAGSVTANRDAFGISNPVTAVLLGFRAYDTLLETIVITVALVAVWSLTPAELWRGHPRPGQAVRPDGVMTSYARLLIPAGLVIAVYLVWAGSDRPGGAFQAGTLLAALWTLGVLGGVEDEFRVGGRWIRAAIVAGPAAFVAIALAGSLAGLTLSYPEGHEKSVIVALEFALTLSIAASLAMLLAGPGRRRG